MLSREDLKLFVTNFIDSNKDLPIKLSKEVLNWKPTDVENAIVETARQYQELGKIK